jgi:hypothetical protein
MEAEVSYHSATAGPTRRALRLCLLLGWVGAVPAPARAHGTEAAGAHGLGFGLAVGLTVALGVLGGAIVARRRRASAVDRTSLLGVSLLLVVLGTWAGVQALRQGPGLAVAGIGGGAAVTWLLRHRASGAHRGCDDAALGAVVLHRFVEGAVLATLYAADAAVGVGAALVLGLHAAAETGAVVGLWGPRRWRWRVVAGVQVGFVAGALGGGLLTQFVTPLVQVLALALLGGVLFTAGVATGSRHYRVSAA